MERKRSQKRSQKRKRLRRTTVMTNTNELRPEE
jgi:hypothetical protein